MKKFTILIAALMLVCFAVPAMAVEWNFYGSARINTWYVSDDYGKDGQRDFPLATTSPPATDSKDSSVRWGSNGHDNSRLGARVKHENVSGRVEIQLKGDSKGDPGNIVDSRLIFGVWNFGAGKLKVGKDYTPITQFVSGQAFEEDLGLLGVGTMYGNRTPQIALAFGGFEIALIEPDTDLISGLGGSTTSVPIGTFGGTPVSVPVAVGANGDVDSYLPKIEAKWGMAFDTWNFNIMGGYQYYSIEDVTSAKDGKKNDIDVTSYAIGADGGVNFGPGYVKAALSWSRNPGNAFWHLPGLRTALGGSAIWDGDDDTKDNDVFMGTLVGGLKVSDMLSFEAGFGYRQDDSDGKFADGKSYEKDKVWEAYLQSVIVMAPGVYVVPEVGYTDYMDGINDKDEGSQMWLGAKWQIDF
jgi:hypothetical protein